MIDVETLKAYTYDTMGAIHEVGKEMESTYRLDFLINEDIIVELKSVDA